MDLEGRYAEIAVSPCMMVLYCNHCSHFLRSAMLARTFQYSILSERRVRTSHEPTIAYISGSWVCLIGTPCFTLMLTHGVPSELAKRPTG
jgi:hypothetical protein